MAQYRVDVSEPAENDLRDIVRYIASQLVTPVSALHMMELLEEAMAGLSDMPQRYPFVADERLSQMGYRKLILKNTLYSFPLTRKTRWLTSKESCMAGATGSGFYNCCKEKAAL